MKKNSFTTGEVAKISSVTKRTVIKWIDSDKLKGYRIPGSSHRRVAKEDLATFLREHGIPDYRDLLPRPKVLIVDDDADFTELLQDALREQYEIEVAGTGVEAALRLPLFRPDVILLDIRLPDVNGLDLCRQVRTLGRTQGASILAMSAYGSDVDAAEVRRSGAAGFLPKPLKIRELRSRLASMVG